MNRNFSAELKAARQAGDWEAHARIWEERRFAEVEHDETELAKAAGGIAMPSDTRDATTRRCLEEQSEASTSAFYARRYMERGLFGRAAQEQREAAYHFKQMAWRLDRLCGFE